jgi:hypothetical protein
MVLVHLLLPCLENSDAYLQGQNQMSFLFYNHDFRVKTEDDITLPA